MCRLLTFRGAQLIGAIPPSAKGSNRPFAAAQHGSVERPQNAETGQWGSSARPTGYVAMRSPAAAIRKSLRRADNAFTSCASGPSAIYGHCRFRLQRGIRHSWRRTTRAAHGRLFGNQPTRARSHQLHQFRPAPRIPEERIPTRSSERGRSPRASPVAHASSMATPHSSARHARRPRRGGVQSGSTGSPARRHSGRPSASRRAETPAARSRATASNDSTHQGPRQ
jgi:hypothetical protein